MTRSRPPEITVTSASDLEHQSRLTIEMAVRPWRMTVIGAQDDFGRDAVIQVIVPGTTHLTPSSLLFAVQMKATAAPFEEDHPLQLESRHLLLWTGAGSPATVVFFWSKANNALRVRTARQIAAELDRTRPTWRNQATVSVPFGDHAAFTGTADLARVISDDVDLLGGVKAFHRARRRTIIAALFASGRRTSTETRFLARGEDDGVEDEIILGPGWCDGEIHFPDRDARRVLAQALLLYEEVWIPAAELLTLAAVIGDVGVVVDLVARRRIVFFGTQRFVGVRRRAGEHRVQAVSFGVHGDPVAQTRKFIEDLVAGVHGPKALVDAMRREMHVETVGVTDRVLAETKKDLGNPHIRNLLGLSPVIGRETEPAWDASLLNRLLHLNVAFAVADSQALDVVDLEAGLSRVATEKWYTQFAFDRSFPSSDAFDHVMRSSGIPDLGSIVDSLPMAEIVAVSDSAAAQDFRDWFWGTVAVLVGSGGRARELMSQAAQVLAPSASSPFRLAAELKLRFFERLGGTYVLGAGVGEAVAGFATRADQGGKALIRQRQIQKRLRLAAIARISDSEPYALCPCGSGERFRFCCGPGRAESTGTRTAQTR